MDVGTITVDDEARSVPSIEASATVTAIADVGRDPTAAGNRDESRVIARNAWNLFRFRPTVDDGTGHCPPPFDCGGCQPALGAHAVKPHQPIGKRTGRVAPLDVAADVGDPGAQRRLHDEDRDEPQRHAGDDVNRVVHTAIDAGHGDDQRHEHGDGR